MTREDLIPPLEALPPLSRDYAGKRNFAGAGQRFLRTALNYGLTPQARVLDLGCGVGRFAVALADYLEEPGGSYVGIDTSPEAIAVCEEWIAPKLENFRFELLEVFNANYNRGAQRRASETRLPLEDGSIDYVFSNSLFTHLLPDDAAHYLLEIGRVLKPGGRTLNTMFLLNGESLKRLDGPDSRHDAPHHLDGVARVKRPERPEAWIAFDEEFIRDGHSAGKLTIESVRYGKWSGREPTGPGVGAKDIVVAVREG